MTFFSEQSDAFLCEWLTSPTWFVDKPSENAKFYRFAATLIQDTGQLDIREIRCMLEEAAQAWAADYAARGGDARIAVLCERLQVLFDFFGAVQSGVPSNAYYTQHQALFPSLPDTVKPLQESSSATAASVPVPQKKLPEASVPAALQDLPRLPKPRKVRKVRQKVEAPQEHLEEDDFPSSERWKRFWFEVVRLHALLLERRGELPPPRIPSDDPKAIHAEMGRWAEEVLTATEITGAEKRDLIGTVIDKVILPDHRIEGSTITIKWLK